MYMNYDMKSTDIVTWSKCDRKARAVGYEKYTLANARVYFSYTTAHVFYPIFKLCL